MPKQKARFGRSGFNTWPVAILLVIALSYTPLGDRLGLLKTIRGATNAVLSMVGLRGSTADDINWMMAYWEDNANHYSLSREDAARMARACLDYDRNPRQRFAELVGCTTKYGGSVAQAFHSYDPDTHRFTDSPTPDNVGGESVQLTNAGRLLLIMTMQDDVPNANFLERVMDSPSKHSDNGAVSSPTPPPMPSLETTPFSIKLVKPVTIQTPSGTITLQTGTTLPYLSYDRNNVRFRYDGADYDIPADATDLKP
jgi:hypothetical protein